MNVNFDNKDERSRFISSVKNNNLSISEIDNILSSSKLGYYDELEYLLELYAKEYSINKEHLVTLCKLMSMELIKNLHNKNIISILNMDDEHFNKFINLFRKDNIKLDEHSLNNIFEAFAQRAFTINNRATISAFTKTLNYIKKNKTVDAERVMISVFRDNFDMFNGSKWNISSLFKGLLSEDPEAIKFFHDACNTNIDRQRTRYVSDEVADYKKNYLENVYETNQAIKTMLRYLDYASILKYAKRVYGFSDKEEELLYNKDLMTKLVNFKNDTSIPLSNEEKKSLFIFNKLMMKTFLTNKNMADLEDLFEVAGVKRSYKIPDIDKYFLLDTLSNLKFKKIYNVLDNNESYKKLDELLSKYKFLSFNYNFYGVEVEADTYCDPLTVASIMMNSDHIIDEISESFSEMNMMTIMDEADTYSDISKRYELLFGENNFRYLTLNPSPNKSVYSKNERRKAGLEYLKNGYERKYVDVPSCDKIYNLKNGKDINVVIGNYTNPINLTLGERTGSCARIGGLADSLFEFCQTNEKGFNIVFKSPDGRFASKVCGFRNGNTVFLNQLRESVIKDYNDYDLIDAIEQVTSDLIDISKDSPHPIENVIISEERVMANSDYKLSEISFNSFFEEMGGDFAIDISKKCAIILNTANKDKSLCEFKPGDENSYKYAPVRDKIKYSQDPTIVVARMNALNEYLNGKSIDDIVIDYKPYKRCISGEDWYIAFDEDDNLTVKVFDISRNN